MPPSFSPMNASKSPSLSISTKVGAPETPTPTPLKGLFPPVCAAKLTAYAGATPRVASKAVAKAAHPSWCRSCRNRLRALWKCKRCWINSDTNRRSSRRSHFLPECESCLRNRLNKFPESFFRTRRSWCVNSRIIVFGILEILLNFMMSPNRIGLERLHRIYVTAKQNFNLK